MNASLISPEELCDLIGLPINDPAFGALRERLGDCEEAVSSDGPEWIFGRDGIALSFRTMFGNKLQSISLFGSKAEAGMRKYKQPLPAGLKFRMPDKAVQPLLAPSFYTDRWGYEFHRYQNLVLSLGYDEDRKLNLLSLFLPESAAELGAR